MIKISVFAPLFSLFLLISSLGVWARPNIIFIMADDLGSWILSCEGYPNTHTPNLDQLAREGLLLENAFSVRQIFSHLDWFPTLAAMAEATLPEGLVITGNNALPMMEGNPSVERDNNLFGQYSSLRSMRTREWKLVRQYGNRKADEFYNLVNDPNERSNLSGSSDPAIQAIKQAVETLMLEAMREFGDNLEFN